MRVGVLREEARCIALFVRACARRAGVRARLCNTVVGCMCNTLVGGAWLGCGCGLRSDLGRTNWLSSAIWPFTV